MKTNNIRFLLFLFLFLFLIFLTSSGFLSITAPWNSKLDKNNGNKTNTRIGGPSKYTGPLIGQPNKATSSAVARHNRGMVEYSREIVDHFKALAARKAGAEDVEFVRLVSDVLDQPVGHGMRLRIPHSHRQTEQSVEVAKVLNNKRGGFFVECGANDGEDSSNTLWLEQERDWSGVLVEADPHFYTKILATNRRAWSLHACLSPNNYVSMMPFVVDNGGTGKLSQEEGGGEGERERGKGVMTPCVPLETILLALNRSHIDYFSLDVEGLELKVLKTIPFDKITIDVLSVEHAHTDEGKNALLVYMNSKHYGLHKDVTARGEQVYADDFIFVRDDIK